MAGPSEQEVVPEYKSILNPHTRTRHGMCPITQIRHGHERLQTHSLYFEVHGSGPQKIVFIMGLNNSSFSWLPQVDHFGKLERYSTLVFDNRGVGFSGSPLGPYSSSGMAEDVVCLLDYLEWTEDHNLHVVGVSLGGMIAQELACRIPDRILSLSLVATRAGGEFGTVTRILSDFVRIMRLFSISDPDQKIPILQEMLFPKEWLDSLAEDDAGGRTNRQVQYEVYRRRMEFAKPPTFNGFLGQMAAVLTHNVVPSRLANVSASVPKVLILNGAEDTLVSPTEGENLKRHMPEAEFQCWEKTGHGVCSQYRKRFNQLLERVFEEGKGQLDARQF